MQNHLTAHTRLRKSKGRKTGGIAESSRKKLPHPVTGTGCGSHQLLFDLFTYYSRYSAESVNYGCGAFRAFRAQKPKLSCCQTPDYS